MEYIKDLIAWIHIHPHLAGLFTFIIAMMESMAIAGLLIPGSMFMSAIGGLVGAGILPFWTIVFCGVAGAVLGDGVSYWLGYHYHERIRIMWPFSKLPKLMMKGEDFFSRHGAKSVVLGRFVGPVRPMIPLIAGMMNMPTRRFFAANIFSAFLWAPLYMLPGILIGATAHELPSSVATEFLIFVVIALVLLWLAVWLIRHIILKIWNVFDHWLGRLWQNLRAEERYRDLINFLQDPRDPEGQHQLTGALAGFLFLFLFLVIAISVAHEDFATFLNLPVFHLMRSFYSPAVAKVMVAITMLGKPSFLLPLVFFTAAWLFWKQRFRASIHIIVVIGLGYALVGLVAAIMGNPRPPGMLAPIGSSSFPSGHATLTTLVFGYLATIIAFELPRKQRFIPYLCVAILVVCVTISRLYLNAHWLTDVVGGICLGLSLIFFGTVSYRRRYSAALPLKGFFIVGIVTLALSYSFYFYTQYQKQVINYTPYWPTSTITYNAWWSQKDHYEPMYRTTHFGRPIQLINVEWASSLQNIESTLQTQGWQLEGKMDLSNTLSHFSLKPNKKLPSLFPRLYRDRPPVAVFTLQKDNGIYVLSLWNAYTFFSDSEQPLWYGIVELRPLPGAAKTIKAAAPEQDREALRHLSPYLVGYEWKIVTNPNAPDDVSEDIALIRPKH